MTRKSAARFSDQVMPIEIYMTRKSAARFSEQLMPNIQEA
jgi:hypothetical protein